MEKYIAVAAGLVVGLAPYIPIVAKLLEYKSAAFQSQGWGSLVALTIRLVEEAEGMFSNGTTRREWVLNTVEAAAAKAGYQFDANSVGDLIDTLCDMSLAVNCNTAGLEVEYE